MTNVHHQINGKLQFKCCVGYRKYTLVGLGCSVVMHLRRFTTKVMGDMSD